MLPPNYISLHSFKGVVFGSRHDLGRCGVHDVINAIDDAVQPFIDEHDYTFTVLHADNAVQSDYGVSGIPVVYLVDRQGRVRWHRVGFGPGGEEEMGREIEKLLNEPAEAPAPDAAGDML